MEIKQEFANQILILKYKNALKLEAELELIEKEIVKINGEKKDIQVTEDFLKKRKLMKKKERKVMKKIILKIMTKNLKKLIKKIL